MCFSQGIRQDPAKPYSVSRGSGVEPTVYHLVPCLDSGSSSIPAWVPRQPHGLQSMQTGMSRFISAYPALPNSSSYQVDAALTDPDIRYNTTYVERVVVDH